MPPGGANPFARGADRKKFAEFYAELDPRDAPPTVLESVCVGPIKYTGQAELQRDIDNFKAALAKVNVAEGFLPVAAPSSVIPDRKNEYYPSDGCLPAGDRRGHARRIPHDRRRRPARATRRCARRGDLRPHGAAESRSTNIWRGSKPRSICINHALEGIPEDKVRYHVCWGSWPGPHTTDVPLKDIVDLVLKVRARAYVIEGANPRHEHEWQVWKNVKLPPGRILMPGVISHATNVVEHPELVAERITRLAKLVGRENVIAGTDCGFAQGPFFGASIPSIMWAKLGALAEGARARQQGTLGLSGAGATAARI